MPKRVVRNVWKPEPSLELEPFGSEISAAIHTSSTALVSGESSHFSTNRPLVVADGSALRPSTLRRSPSAATNLSEANFMFPLELTTYAKLPVGLVGPVAAGDPPSQSNAPAGPLRVPRHFLCPISGAVMRDPVRPQLLKPSGQLEDLGPGLGLDLGGAPSRSSYERAALAGWLAARSTSLTVGAGAAGPTAAGIRPAAAGGPGAGGGGAALPLSVAGAGPGAAAASHIAQHYLVPNVALRREIQEWLQQHGLDHSAADQLLLLEWEMGRGSDDEEEDDEEERHAVAGLHSGWRVGKEAQGGPRTAEGRAAAAAAAAATAAAGLPSSAVRVAQATIRTAAAAASSDSSNAPAAPQVPGAALGLYLPTAVGRTPQPGIAPIAPAAAAAAGASAATPSAATPSAMPRMPRSSSSNDIYGLSRHLAAAAGGGGAPLPRSQALSTAPAAAAAAAAAFDFSPIYGRRCVGAGTQPPFVHLTPQGVASPSPTVSGVPPPAPQAASQASTAPPTGRSVTRPSAPSSAGLLRIPGGGGGPAATSADLSSSTGRGRGGGPEAATGAAAAAATAGATAGSVLVGSRGARNVQAAAVAAGAAPDTASPVGATPTVVMTSPAAAAAAAVAVNVAARRSAPLLEISGVAGEQLSASITTCTGSSDSRCIGGGHSGSGSGSRSSVESSAPVVASVSVSVSASVSASIAAGALGDDAAAAQLSWTGAAEGGASGFIANGPPSQPSPGVPTTRTSAKAVATAGLPPPLTDSSGNPGPRSPLPSRPHVFSPRLPPPASIVVVEQLSGSQQPQGPLTPDRFSTTEAELQSTEAVSGAVARGAAVTTAAATTAAVTTAAATTAAVTAMPRMSAVPPADALRRDGSIAPSSIPPSLPSPAAAVLAGVPAIPPPAAPPAGPPADTQQMVVGSLSELLLMRNSDGSGRSSGGGGSAGRNQSPRTRPPPAPGAPGHSPVLSLDCDNSHDHPTPPSTQESCPLPAPLLLQPSPEQPSSVAAAAAAAAVGAATPTGTGAGASEDRRPVRAPGGGRPAEVGSVAAAEPGRGSAGARSRVWSSSGAWSGTTALRSWLGRLPVPWYGRRVSGGGVGGGADVGGSSAAGRRLHGAAAAPPDLDSGGGGGGGHAASDSEAGGTATVTGSGEAGDLADSGLLGAGPPRRMRTVASTNSLPHLAALAMAMQSADGFPEREPLRAAPSAAPGWGMPRQPPQWQQVQSQRPPTPLDANEDLVRELRALMAAAGPSPSGSPGGGALLQMQLRAPRRAVGSESGASEEAAVKDNDALWGPSAEANTAIHHHDHHDHVVTRSDCWPQQQQQQPSPQQHQHQQLRQTSASCRSTFPALAAALAATARPPPSLPPPPLKLPVELPLQWLSASQLAESELTPRNGRQAAERQAARLWSWLRSAPPAACRDLFTLLRCMPPGSVPAARLRCLPLEYGTRHRVTAMAVLPPPPPPLTLPMPYMYDGYGAAAALGANAAILQTHAASPPLAAPAAPPYAVLLTRDRPYHVVLEELSDGPGGRAPPPPPQRQQQQQPLTQRQDADGLTGPNGWSAHSVMATASSAAGTGPAPAMASAAGTGPSYRGPAGAGGRSQAPGPPAAPGADPRLHATRRLTSATEVLPGGGGSGAAPAGTEGLLAEGGCGCGPTSGRCWAVPAVKGTVTAVAACPRGGSLAVATSAGQVFLWRAFPADHPLNAYSDATVRKYSTGGSGAAAGGVVGPARPLTSPPPAAEATAAAAAEWHLCARLAWPENVLRAALEYGKVGVVRQGGTGPAAAAAATAKAQHAPRRSVTGYGSTNSGGAAGAEADAAGGEGGDGAADGSRAGCFGGASRSVTALAYDGSGSVLYAACCGVVAGWKLRRFDEPERRPELWTQTALLLTPDEYGYQPQPQDPHTLYHHLPKQPHAQQLQQQHDHHHHYGHSLPQDEEPMTGPRRFHRCASSPSLVRDCPSTSASSATGAGAGTPSPLPPPFQALGHKWGDACQSADNLAFAMADHDSTARAAATSDPAAAIGGLCRTAGGDGDDGGGSHPRGSTGGGTPPPGGLASSGRRDALQGAAGRAPGGTGAPAYGPPWGSSSPHQDSSSAAPSPLLSSRPLSQRSAGGSGRVSGTGYDSNCGGGGGCGPPARDIADRDDDGGGGSGGGCYAGCPPTVCILAACASGSHLAFALADGAVHLAVHVDAPDRTVCVRLLPPGPQPSLAAAGHPRPGAAVQLGFSADGRRLWALALGLVGGASGGRRPLEGPKKEPRRAAAAAAATGLWQGGGWASSMWGSTAGRVAAAAQLPPAPAGGSAPVARYEVHRFPLKPGDGEEEGEEEAGEGEDEEEGESRWGYAFEEEDEEDEGEEVGDGDDDDDGDGESERSREESQHTQPPAGHPASNRERRTQRRRRLSRPNELSGASPGVGTPATAAGCGQRLSGCNSTAVPGLRRRSGVGGPYEEEEEEEEEGGGGGEWLLQSLEVPPQFSGAPPMLTGLSVSPDGTAALVLDTRRSQLLHLDFRTRTARPLPLELPPAATASQQHHHHHLLAVASGSQAAVPGRGHFAAPAAAPAPAPTCMALLGGSREVLLAGEGGLLRWRFGE